MAANTPVTPGLRRVSVAAVLLVAGVAAAISYSHMRTLALDAGEGDWQATLLPLSVDGMMVVASMTAIARRRAGQSSGPWVTLGFLLGVAASVAANVAAAQPSTVGRLVAAWPPLALLLAWEMALGAPGAAGTTDRLDASPPGNTGEAGSRSADGNRHVTGPPAGRGTAEPATSRLGSSNPAQIGTPNASPASHESAQPGSGPLSSSGGSDGRRRSAGLADVQAVVDQLVAEDVPPNRRNVTQRVRSSGLSLSNERADALLDEAIHRRPELQDEARV